MLTSLEETERKLWSDCRMEPPGELNYIGMKQPASAGRNERWKIYQVLPDADAEEHGQMRVVDESGDDYLYPSKYFKPLRLSPALVRFFPRRVRVKSGRPATIRTA